MTPCENLFLVLVIVAVYLGGGARTSAGYAESSAEDVNRLNYGVYFRHVRKYSPVTGIWRNTFVIPIPFSRSVSRSKNVEDRETDNENQSELGEDICGSEPIENESLCALYRHNIRRILSIKRQSVRETKRVIDMVYDILPETNIGNSRRSLVPFVGTLSKSLFGTATVQDVSVLRTQIKQVAESQNHEIDVMKKTVDDMSSFVVKSQDAFEKLGEQIENATEESFRFVEMKSREIGHHIMYVSNMSAAAIELIHRLDKLK